MIKIVAVVTMVHGLSIPVASLSSGFEVHLPGKTSTFWFFSYVSGKRASLDLPLKRHLFSSEPP
jgi:hypothetical protein